MNLEMDCAYCSSENVKLQKNGKLKYELPNPGKIEMTADFYECQDCGEKYLDEKNMEKVCGEIDKAKGI